MLNIWLLVCILILHTWLQQNCCQPAPIQHVPLQNWETLHLEQWSLLSWAHFWPWSPLHLIMPQQGGGGTVEWHTARSRSTPMPCIPHPPGHPCQTQKLPEGPVRFNMTSEKDRLPPHIPGRTGAAPRDPSPPQCSALPHRGQLHCSHRNGMEREKDIADLKHVCGSGLLWII